MFLKRAFSSLNFLCMLEPPDLSRYDRKQSDVCLGRLIKKLVLKDYIILYVKVYFAKLIDL